MSTWSGNRDRDNPPTLRQLISQDRWEATGAREMVSTIENRNQYKELVGPPSTSLSEPSSPYGATTLVSAPNHGASSLVQMWEARLGRSTSMNNRSNNDVVTELSATTVSRSSSSSTCNFTLSNKEHIALNDEPPGNFEARGGRESDQTTSNGSSSCSESTLRPSERPKIADLIRKLMASNPRGHEKSNVRESSPSRDQNLLRQHDHCVGPEPSEQTSTQSPHGRSEGLNITHSPRLRGRQAFNDVLLMMERDMKDELETVGKRKAVSGFSKKGRIQSLLRFKILQRGLSFQDGWRPRSGSAGANHGTHGSAIHPREKLTATDQSIHSNADTIAHSEIYSISDQQSQCLQGHGQQYNIEEKQQISNVENQGDRELHPQYSSCTEISIPTEDVNEESSLASNMTYPSTEEANFPEVPETTDSYSGWYREWPLEGEETDGESMYDTGSERFLGVARPRSYWEDLRNAWYRQMLAADSANSEICELLQRRTVSNVLTTECDFRDRMNDLMISHVEKQSHHRANEEEEEDQSAMSGLETVRRFLSSYLQQQSYQSLQNGSHEAEEEEEEEREDEEQEGEHEVRDEQYEEEEEEEDEEMYLRRQERMEELMSNHLQVHADSISSHADEDDDENEEEDEIDENAYGREDRDDGTVEELERDVAESIVTQRYRGEPIEIFHQNTSLASTSSQSSPMRNNDCDHQVISRYPHKVIGSYHQDAFSSGGRISMEMELINELIGQMKQLYQEMSELRRSISNCIDVQVKFQDSIKQEILTVREGWRRTEEGGPRKGYCCICYNMKVNSLLYRCGHMCTCLECARELQLGSGKCPICRAPILDMVRAYTES